MENKAYAGFMVLLFFISIPVWMVMNAYTLSYLWLWFVVPLGAPVIGLVHAMGLATLVKFVSIHKVEAKADSEEALDKLVRYIGFAYTFPIITFIFGFIFKSFM